MDFADTDPRLLPGELETRPRRHETYTWDVPTPKTRMLGPTPSIFFRVEPHKTPRQVFGDPQNN